jgi:hypothetical protein
VAIAGYRFLADDARRWIVLCPKIAQSVWAEEIAKTLAVPHTVICVTGKAEERKLLLKTEADETTLTVWILNHEASWRLKKILYKMAPDIVTVDESHRIKGQNKQSRSIAVLGKRARFRNILTGTFISNPLDVFAQMQFLDPKIFDTNFAGFKERYVRTYGYGGFKPKTFKNLDEMMGLIRPMAFELSREDAGGFPAIDVSTVKFELTNPTLRHYREMEAEFRTMIKTEDVEASIILVQALRLQQLTGGYLPLSDGTETEVGRDRIRTVAELIDGYPRDYPLVIVARFLYELKSLEQVLKSMGRRSSVIRGGVDQTAARQAFQSGKVHTCLVQLRAGIAIDLSRANTAIFYSMNHSLIDYEQARSRIIAAGQSGVSFIHIVAEDTVDEVIFDAVQGKRDVAKELLKVLR